MGRLLLASVAVGAGAVVVGPLVSHAVLRWIAWRGVLPLVLGWEPIRAEVGAPRAGCRARRWRKLPPAANRPELTTEPPEHGRPPGESASGLPEPEPRLGLEPEPGPEREPGPDTKLGSDTKPGPDTKLGSDTKPGPDTKLGSDTMPGLAPEPEPEPGPEREPGSDTKPGPDTRPGPGGVALLMPAASGAPPGGLPALPWLAARGRCGHCGEPVGRWALGVEVATGLGFGVVAARFGWSVELLPMLVLVAGLVATSAVDLICGRIPTRFVWVTGAGLVATITLAAAVERELSSLVGAAVGSATYLVVLGLQWLVSRGRMGLGDVRLGMVAGLVTGWLGWLSWLEWGREHLSDGETDAVLLTFGAWGATLLSLVVGGLAASIDGLVRRVVKGSRQPYPFGPWLSVGALVAALLVARSGS